MESSNNQFLLPTRNIIDMLSTAPSRKPFLSRVEELALTASLQSKVFAQNTMIPGIQASRLPHLSERDEKELATEVLLYRHKFTRIVFANRSFRQAALSVIQNIYLFQQRKIFFGTTTNVSAERERREALLLFSQAPKGRTLPLAKTFQHLIIARVWNRIAGQAGERPFRNQGFTELHEVVERLNTLRNIYILLCTGLVRKLTRNVNHIYRQSISPEDARQIGSFGIARAAYRYHPTSGLRFSTYASYWILKEIQRQALRCRLIRIPSTLVEQFSRAVRADNGAASKQAALQLATATTEQVDGEINQLSQLTTDTTQQQVVEQKELQHILLKAIDSTLSQKSGDIIQRRFGIGLYRGMEQSVIEISKIYGVTRGSIYQLEQSALTKLRGHLCPLV